MIDVGIFATGCGVSFLALCGAYAYMRERFLDGTEKRHEPVRKDSGPSVEERAAAR